LFMPRLQLH